MQLSLYQYLLVHIHEQNRIPILFQTRWSLQPRRCPAIQGGDSRQDGVDENIVNEWCLQVECEFPKATGATDTAGNARERSRERQS